jgi:uncharacterized phage protein (TIGR02218 family)
MKDIGVELLAHLQLEVTTLAELWLLTRTDTETFAFTNHDVDITYNGIIYEATGGFDSTTINQNSLLAVNNLEVVGLLDVDKISRPDIHAGLYDAATVDIVVINYKDPAMGHYILAEGWTVGDVTIEDNKFRFEARSLLQKLQQTIGHLYSPECRAELYDDRCQVNPLNFFETGTIAADPTHGSFIITALDHETDLDGGFPIGDRYAYGTVTWTTGKNAGLTMEIRKYDPLTNLFTLSDAMIYAIEEGDTVSVAQGCDKRGQTCVRMFDNFWNFRGEPHLPGFDKMMNYPDRDA